MVTRANKRKFHYIYKITRNDGSGKFYIGMHSTDDLEDVYFGSGQLLWKSIKKHGKEKHTKEILEFLPTREALKLREKELVNEELLGDKRCMNLKLGGEGGGFFYSRTQQVNATIAGNKSSKRLAEEYKKKLSNAQKKAYAEGRRVGWEFHSGMLGKQHNNKTKEKMSVSQTGAQNSQFETCWVCNETGPKKINKDFLEDYLSIGYRRGRK